MPFVQNMLLSRFYFAHRHANVMNQEMVELLAKQVSVDERLANSVNPPFHELWIVPSSGKIQQWIRHMRLIKGLSKPLIRVRFCQDHLSNARPVLRQSETGKFYDMREHLNHVDLLSSYQILANKN